MFLLYAGNAAAQFLTDPDKDWEEEAYVLPPFPNADSLREFYVTATSPNEFYVDESSLDVGEDGVVRYVLVIRSPSGAESVTFEGLRCVSTESRIYATGRADGEWSKARRSEWEPIRANAYNMPRAILAGEHLCNGTVPPHTRAEALTWLRNGSDAGRYR